VGEDEGQRQEDEGRGIRDEFPRASGVAIATGIGGVWGAVCYSILWEGSPVAVDRRFVQSAPGTLMLLPARIVLWAIRRVELLAGRTFDFSSNHLWIGLLTSVVGAALAVGGYLLGRMLIRRLRRGP
jgi:hypothetical protein